MANPYYNHGTAPIAGARGASSTVRSEFDLVAAGFDALNAVGLITAASPTLTGDPKAPTAAVGDNDTSISTTAFVQVATGNNRRAVVGADTLILTDKGKLIDCSGAFTLAVTAAATLGDGWWCRVRNSGTGNITIDPNGAETIDGVATGILYPSFVFMIQCTGTAFNVIRLEGRRMEVFTSGTTWVCPVGVGRVKGRIVGGGGSGGRSGTTNPASGGGAGGYSEFDFVSVPGTTYNYTIGAGGAAGAGSGSNGAVGTASTFVAAVTITANGGGAGQSAGTTAGGGTATNGTLNVTGGGSLGSFVTISLGGSSQLGSGGMFALDPPTVASAVGFGSGGYGVTTSGSNNAGQAGVLILEY